MHGPQQSAPHRVTRGACDRFGYRFWRVANDPLARKHVVSRPDELAGCMQRTWDLGIRPDHKIVESFSFFLSLPRDGSANQIMSLVKHHFCKWAVSNPWLDIVSLFICTGLLYRGHLLWYISQKEKLSPHHPHVMIFTIYTMWRSSDLSACFIGHLTRLTDHSVLWLFSPDSDHLWPDPVVTDGSWMTVERPPPVQVALIRGVKAQKRWSALYCHRHTLITKTLPFSSHNSLSG